MTSVNIVHSTRNEQLRNPRIDVFWTAYAFILCLGMNPAAQAAYSIWSGTVRGNTQNVGMAGALTGLADGYYGSVINPAGTSLTLNHIDLDLTQSIIADGYNMAPGQTFVNKTVGIAIPLNSFGMSLGTSSPFQSTNASGNQVSLNEYRLSFSQAFLDNHLSLGIGIGFDSVTLNSESISQVGYTIGVLYRFPNRIYVGSAFNTGLLIGPFLNDQLISLPQSATLGVGWIPNRLFRAAFSLQWVDAETNTFDFREPTLPVGRYSVLQPNVGISYEFLSLQNISARIDAGAYLEAIRTTLSYRPHSTVGLQIHPWFVHLVYTVDIANQYQNTLVNVGIDIKDLLTRLQVLPRAVTAPPAGLLPKPFEINEDWMSRNLQDHPDKDLHEIQPDSKSFEKTIKTKINQLFKPNSSKTQVHYERESQRPQ